MKRIILFSMVFALLFSLFGCKTADYQDTAEVDTIVVDRKDKQPTEQPPEPLPETEEKNDPPTLEQPGTEDKDDEPVPKADKADDSGFTVDMPFSASEVVVSLNVNESSKGKKYTPADFPQLDVFYVFEFNYYRTKYHPDHHGVLTLMLMLNTPSKERVLEYVKILEKDERVYSAEPNFIVDLNGEDSNYCTVYLTDEELAKNKKYTVDDFAYPGIISVNGYTAISLFKPDDGERPKRRWLSITYDNSSNEPLKHLVSDNKVSSVIPHIIDSGYILDELVINMKETDHVYTAEDFPGIDVKEVEYRENTTGILLHLKQGGYRNLFEAYHKLKNDERFDEVILCFTGMSSPSYDEYVIKD